jgi:hypothetical protein
MPVARLGNFLQHRREMPNWFESNAMAVERRASRTSAIAAESEARNAEERMVLPSPPPERRQAQASWHRM